MRQVIDIEVVYDMRTGSNNYLIIWDDGIRTYTDDLNRYPLAKEFLNSNTLYRTYRQTGNVTDNVYFYTHERHLDVLNRLYREKRNGTFDNFKTTVTIYDNESLV